MGCVMHISVGFIGAILGAAGYLFQVRKSYDIWTYMLNGMLTGLLGSFVVWIVVVFAKGRRAK